MRIYLHADDFGATKSVNENILKTWLAGSLNSSSIMANGEALLDAAKEVNAVMNRKLRLVVHLNLSEGPSTGDPSKLGLLVNKKRIFRHGFLGLWLVWLLSTKHSRRKLTEQVETEWREQIRRVVEVLSPCSVTGVDSHIHVHMLPFLFPIAVRLAREFNLPEIRISNEYFHFSFRESLRVGFIGNIAKHILLNLLARSARRLAKEYGMTSADAIVGVLYSGRMTYATALSGLNAARHKGVNWIEIIFHPGRANLAERGRWAEKSGIGRFYMSPHRDVERDALLNIQAKFL